MVVAGSLRKPEIVANSLIELLDGAERFCFHRAAQLRPELVEEWLTRVRAKALARARTELASLLQHVGVGGIVAKEGAIPALDVVLAAHARIHAAEGLFYRDVFRAACQIPCRIIPPASLDITAVGKLPTRPWGREQKLAALAAWQVMSH